MRAQLSHRKWPPSARRDTEEAETTALLSSAAVPSDSSRANVTSDSPSCTGAGVTSDSPSLSPLKISATSDMLDAEVASSWTEDEDQLSREKLQMIKARTMYEMVEEVELPGGPCKLLFLTNVQADLLASSDDSMQKMLDALEVPRPQLVISLLNSLGSSNFMNLAGPGGWDESAAAGLAGIVSSRTPFLNAEEEWAAEQRIDGFMADVLIPLAAQTNAIVITPPFSDSILTIGLMRMYSVQRSKWGGKPPFTIISAGAGTNELYTNPDLSAVWRDVRKQSRAWRSRDKKLLELVHKLDVHPDGSLREQRLDFDPNCTCIITTDMIEAKKESKFDKGPFAALLNNLVRYLGRSLPSLTVKAGSATKATLADAGKSMAALDIALNSAQSGSPVLFLDVRERPLVQATDRVALIEAAKTAMETHCNALLQAGLAECFDVSSIAYVYDALVGDGSQTASDEHMGGGGDDALNGRRKGAPSVDKRLALHEAILLASDESSGRAQKGATQGMKRATPEQAGELATWLANRYFKDAFEVLVDKAEREAKGETYQTLYKDRIQAMQIWTAALFASPNFHQVNLCDRDEAKRVVRHLVRLDRLPKHNPIEGLLLLQDAWKSYDIAVHLAEYYKGWSKLLFLLQLLVVWAVTFTETSSLRAGDESPGRCDLFADNKDAENACLKQKIAELQGGLTVSYGEIAFFLAAVASILISIDSLLNAKMRWRQLRSGAGSLESMIWCYRTRVGSFELTDSNSRGPETAMRTTLIAWRRDLMSGGDLQVSGLSRRYSADVYKHHQFAESGPLSAADLDDHYSPVQPHKYIELRILPSIAFYEQRTPWYSCQRALVKLLLLGCTLAATLLSRYELAVYVVAISSTAAALTSWQEYTDVGRKTERYTRAAFELHNLLSWWKSLSEVEKASKSTIAQLIHSAEGIISEERLAWMSTANQAPAAAPLDKGDEEQGGKKAGIDPSLSA